MLLVSNKAAFFNLVVAADAPPAVRYAAEELQRYVNKISLAHPDIVTDAEPRARREIVVGESARRRQLFPDVKPAKLAREGYVLRTRDGHLLLLGGSPRGTLYAAHDFLERLGVRWWTPTAETVPSRNHLEIAPLNVQVDPPLIYRATWFRHAMDGDWQARVRLNAGTMTPVHMQPRHGGMERFAADGTSHTYQRLVPTEKYFDQHPEYFSMVDGKRLRHQNQLCPTHPDVASIAADNAGRWLDETPGCRIVSVTQNDWRNWCTCPRCAAMIEHEGAPSGPALHLANEVAKRLEKSHPEALIDTFAYSWTEAAPKHMKARPNVLVRLAPIGNCFGHSIRSCPQNARSRQDFANWAKIAEHLFVWTYVTDFCHYLTPFPNLPPLADDLRFFIEHGVKGVFMQGNGTSLGGDMAELKAYLMARLMWDPTLDAGAIRAEFLQGYYRAAAPAVEEYLAIFERTFAQGGPDEHLHLYRSLWANEANYLQRPVLDRARLALARGQKACDNDPEVLARLDSMVAGLDYTELFYYEHPGKWAVRGDQLHCPNSPRRKELTGRLFRVCRQNRVTHYGEDLGRYTRIEELRRAWLESAGKHPVVRLQAGGSQAMVVPAIGGRVIDFGPAGSKTNFLGRGSQKTFGYPCVGGYEEYSLKNHQSPGFTQAFDVVSTGKSQVTLAATLDTGVVLRRQIRLDPATGEMVIASKLRNPHMSPLPACLRAHLEIDLQTPPAELCLWFKYGRRWVRQLVGEGGLGGAWYEDEVPSAWLLWSEARQLGLVQRWSRRQVGAVHLGTVPAEPFAVALDLAHGRGDQALASKAAQSITHRFRWLTALPTGC